MKIIKEGDLKKAVWRVVSYRFTCPVCGCVFDAEYGDFDLEGRYLSGKAIYGCDCPTCSTHVIRTVQEVCEL